MNNNRLNSL